MSLLANAARGAINFGKFVADDIKDQKLIAAVRDEHDQWAKTAQLGAPYYTLKEATEYRPDDPYYRAAHHVFVFTKMAPRWGNFPGQLVTDDGRSHSWRLWWNNGPLTLDRKVTFRDLDEADRRAEAAGMARASEGVLAAVMADMERMYPASVRVLQAA